MKLREKCEASTKENGEMEEKEDVAARPLTPRYQQQQQQAKGESCGEGSLILAESCIPGTADVGCCHGDHAAAAAGAAAAGVSQPEEKESDLTVLENAISHDLLELYKKPENTDTKSISSASGADLAALRLNVSGSRIPRINHISSYCLSARTGSSVSNQSTALKTSCHSARSPKMIEVRSPRPATVRARQKPLRTALSGYCSARGLEAELKVLKKKYLAIKKESNTMEMALSKIRGQIVVLVTQIHELTSGVRPQEKDLKDIQFAALQKLRNEEGKPPAPRDLAFHKDFIADIQGLWKSAFEVSWDRVSSRGVSEDTRYKKLESIETCFRERVKEYQEVIEGSLFEESKIVEKLVGYENKLKEQEQSMRRAAIEAEQQSMKNQQLWAKYLDDLGTRSKAMEGLKQEISRLQHFNKAVTKNGLSKEKQFKEQVSVFCKQLEDAHRREKHLEKQIEEMRGQLSSSLGSKSGKAVDGGKVVTRISVGTQAGQQNQPSPSLSLLLSQLQDYRKQLAELEAEKMLLIEKNLENRSQPDLPPKSQKGTPRVSKPDSATVKAPSENNQFWKDRAKYFSEKLEKLEAARSEAEDKSMKLQLRLAEVSKVEETMNSKIFDLATWEEELCLREDRVYQQRDVVRARQQVLQLLKTREKRRIHHGKASYENLCDLVDDQKAEIDELRKTLKGLRTNKCKKKEKTKEVPPSKSAHPSPRRNKLPANPPALTTNCPRPPASPGTKEKPVKGGSAAQNKQGRVNKPKASKQAENPIPLMKRAVSFQRGKDVAPKPYKRSVSFQEDVEKPLVLNAQGTLPKRIATPLAIQPNAEKPRKKKLGKSRKRAAPSYFYSSSSEDEAIQKLRTQSKIPQPALDPGGDSSKLEPDVVPPQKWFY